MSRKRFDAMPCSIARTLNLVADGVFSAEPKPGSGRGYEYRLTEKGRDLWAVLTALRLWGDKWIYGPGKEPLLVGDRDDARIVRRLLPADADGRPLDPRRLVARAGPGTSRAVAARYRKSAAKRS